MLKIFISFLVGLYRFNRTRQISLKLARRTAAQAGLFAGLFAMLSYAISRNSLVELLSEDVQVNVVRLFICPLAGSLGAALLCTLSDRYHATSSKKKKLLVMVATILSTPLFLLISQIVSTKSFQEYGLTVFSRLFDERVFITIGYIALAAAGSLSIIIQQDFKWVRNIKTCLTTSLFGALYGVLGYSLIIFIANVVGSKPRTTPPPNPELILIWPQPEDYSLTRGLILFVCCFIYALTILVAIYMRALGRKELTRLLKQTDIH